MLFAISCVHLTSNNTELLPFVTFFFCRTCLSSCFFFFFLFCNKCHACSFWKCTLQRVALLLAAHCSPGDFCSFLSQRSLLLFFVVFVIVSHQSVCWCCCCCFCPMLLLLLPSIIACSRARPFSLSLVTQNIFYSFFFSFSVSIHVIHVRRTFRKCLYACQRTKSFIYTHTNAWMKYKAPLRSHIGIVSVSLACSESLLWEEKILFCVACCTNISLSWIVVGVRRALFAFR